MKTRTTEDPPAYGSLRHKPVGELLDRWQKLSFRQVITDARRRGAATVLNRADCTSLALDEHLELLALGQHIAEIVCHPGYVHSAVRAGASWEAIAAARGITVEQARADYREWAEGQHRLYEVTAGELGMSSLEYQHALDRAGASGV